MGSQTKTQHQTNSTAAPAQEPEGLLDKVMQQTADRLETTVRRVSTQLDAIEGYFRRSLALAKGINEFKAMLDDKVMDDIMALMNSPLGFQTDRSGNGKPLYTKAEVRNCMVTAFLQGAYPVGNEIAILYGQCFLQKAYWRRAVLEILGISDVRMVVGVPITANGKTTVRAACSWKLNGVANRLENEKGEPGITFVTILNAQGPADNACQGKAERQAYMAVYKLIKGNLRTADLEGDEPLADGEVPNETAITLPTDPAMLTVVEKLPEVPATVAKKADELKPEAKRLLSESDKPAGEKARASILRAVADFEANLVAADLCFAGDLYANLKEAHPAKEPVSEWGSNWLKMAGDKCRAFEGACRSRLKDSELHEIAKHLKACDMTPERCVEAMGLPRGTKVEDMTDAQRRSAVKMMREEAAAVASREDQEIKF